MKIWIDKDHKVSATFKNHYSEIETNAFDGMDPKVIECHKYYPPTETTVELVQAWASADEISYRQSIADLNRQNNELLESIADMVEDIYQQDLNIIGSED